MTTIIRSPGYLVTPEMRAHLARRVLLALKRYERRISEIEVMIEDLGGSDNEMKGVEVVFVIGLQEMPPVTVNMISHEPFSAISIASRRARRAVKRAIRNYDKVDHYGLRAIAGYGLNRTAFEGS